MAKQSDPKLLKKIAKTIARIHSLRLPIRKNTHNWQLRQMADTLNETIKTIVPEMYYLFREWNLPNLTQFDVHKEVQWLTKKISRLSYPLVLCHNDLLGTNILVTDSDSEIMIIDLEYCTYGCRGYDLAVFNCQWNFEPQDYDNFALPSEEVINRFIGLYIEANEQLESGYSIREENSPDRILCEVKHYFLVYRLFWVVFYLHLHTTMIEALPFDRKRNYVSERDR